MGWATSVRTPTCTTSGLLKGADDGRSGACSEAGERSGCRVPRARSGAGLLDQVRFSPVAAAGNVAAVGLARSSPTKAAGPIPSLRLVPRPSAALLRDDRDVQHVLLSPRPPTGRGLSEQPFSTSRASPPERVGQRGSSSSRHKNPLVKGQAKGARPRAWSRLRPPARPARRRESTHPAARAGCSRPSGINSPTTPHAPPTAPTSRRATGNKSRTYRQRHIPAETSKTFF